MLVGLVGSGLLGLTETMGVILGADIGTTLTVQLLAFRIYDYAIALSVSAFCLSYGAARKGRQATSARLYSGSGSCSSALNP